MSFAAESESAFPGFSDLWNATSFVFAVQTRNLRICTGLLSILTLAARGLSSFGEDHNTRSGRLIVSKGLSSSNFNSESYIRNLAGKDGKVWHGEGGQNICLQRLPIWL